MSSHPIHATNTALVFQSAPHALRRTPRPAGPGLHNFTDPVRQAAPGPGRIWPLFNAINAKIYFLQHQIAGEQHLRTRERLQSGTWPAASSTLAQAQRGAEVMRNVRATNLVRTVKSGLFKDVMDPDPAHRLGLRSRAEGEARAARRRLNARRAADGWRRGWYSGEFVPPSHADHPSQATAWVMERLDRVDDETRCDALEHIRRNRAFYAVCAVRSVTGEPFPYPDAD